METQQNTGPEPQIRRYERFLRETRGLAFERYEDLWQWSVTELDAFWLSLWDFFELRSATPFTRALSEERMPGARWFEGATLNHAAQVLRHAGSTERPAIVWCNEAMLARRELGELSWPELKRQVGAFAAALRALGVGRGDRVVAYLPNIPQTAVAFLAVASLGAIWSVCAPDMGAMAVLDRFRQIEPKLLIAADGYVNAGQAVDRRPLLGELLAGLPSVEHAVLLRYLDPQA
ncbi:MAG TPA: AMP-binding protein, partial [Roseateles sp.]|nr:AMP-binding protein [Roseateles sp.]